MFVQGGIYRFSYLWLREYELGEESGRKDRPVCLIFRSSNGRLFVVPITTKEPSAERVSMQIPYNEWNRAGIVAQSWIILDEFNSTFENQAYDFASLDPIGRFSEGYLTTLQKQLNALIEIGRARKAPRS